LFSPVYWRDFIFYSFRLDLVDIVQLDFVLKLLTFYPVFKHGPAEQATGVVAGAE
jgi:hypothetical protein